MHGETSPENPALSNLSCIGDVGQILIPTLSSKPRWLTMDFGKSIDFA
jgi:hypothetical protein